MQPQNQAPWPPQVPQPPQQPLPSPVYTPPKKAFNVRLGLGLGLVVGLIIGLIVGFAIGHASSKPKTSDTSTKTAHSSSPTTSDSVFNGVQQKAQDSKRQADILALQTQLEAFFSQNGYYPSLTDMNSASWRAANMKSLDQTALADPTSNCDPSTAACLVTAPKANAYAYQVTDAGGASCETQDTSCMKYTLTATYAGDENGSPTIVRTNLD